MKDMTATTTLNTIELQIETLPIDRQPLRDRLVGLRIMLDTNSPYFAEGLASMERVMTE